MDSLSQWLVRIEDCFNVRICVHDIAGITYTRASLNLDNKWKSHGCAYCDQAKKCIGTKRCMEQKLLVMYCLKRNKLQPFFGICNMGVCEYILPVLQSGQLLAVVFASGVTNGDQETARNKLITFLEKGDYKQKEQTVAAFDQFSQQYQTKREALQFLAEQVRDRLLDEIPAFLTGQSDNQYPVEAVTKRQSSLVKAVMEYIDSTLPATITLQDLSSNFFISKGHLCRVFQKEIGVSILSYITLLRIQRASYELINSDRSISEIAEHAGIEDANYFSRVFRTRMGMTPTEYRETYRNAQGQNK